MRHPRGTREAGGSTQVAAPMPSAGPFPSKCAREHSWVRGEGRGPVLRAAGACDAPPSCATRKHAPRAHKWLKRYLSAPHPHGHRTPPQRLDPTQRDEPKLQGGEEAPPPLVSFVATPQTCTRTPHPRSNPQWLTNASRVRRGKASAHSSGAPQMGPPGRKGGSAREGKPRGTSAGLSKSLAQSMW